MALIVECDVQVLSRLRAIAESAGYEVRAHSHFESARRQLASTDPPSALIVNMRLGEFNGLHLVYLVKTFDPRIRALTYAGPHDAFLAREAQRAGAFYQRQVFLPFSFERFLKAGLPDADRREPSGLDRRTSFRGGRRATDVAILYSAFAAS